MNKKLKTTIISISIPLVFLVVLLVSLDNMKHCSNPSNFCILRSVLPCDIYGAEVSSGYGCTCEDYWEIGGEHYQCPDNPYKEVEGHQFKVPEVIWCNSTESDIGMSEKRGNQCCYEIAYKIEREFLWMDYPDTGTKWVCDPIKERGK